MKAQNKTVETDASVAKFLAAIKDKKRREDCTALVKLFAEQTAFEPKMWGIAIIGFGTYHYVYESGREGDAPLLGMASRSNAIVLYLGCEFEGADKLLEKLGKYKRGKGCFYIQKLEDIDLNVLGKLAKKSVTIKKKK